MSVEGVVVRLEVEGMRHQILHRFSQHNTEVEEIVADAVTRTLEEFSLAREAHTIARGLVSEIVTKEIERALREAFAEPEVRAKLTQLVAAALAPHLPPPSEVTP